MFSAVHPITDFAKILRHFRFAPTAEVTAFCSGAVPSLLNLCEVSVTHTSGLGGRGGSDDEASNNYWVRGYRSAHVRSTGAAMRSHLPWTDGTTLLKGLTVDANKLPTADFDDRWSAMFALAPTTDMAQHVR
jgi:hypothetical protein